jgi:hypothetical protein
MSKMVLIWVGPLLRTLIRSLFTGSSQINPHLPHLLVDRTRSYTITSTKKSLNL